MKQPQKTVLYNQHVHLGAQIVEFGGWDMPMQYGSGIVQEHLATRKRAGLFDVSHMGRFAIRGKEALPFLQYVLSNNAAALNVGESQYTIIPNERGGAVDDAYLYRFMEDEYVLVVNAANREKDWEHFQTTLRMFGQVELVDQTHTLSMLSLQGPLSKDLLLDIIDSGILPDPLRNSLSIVSIDGIRILLARTGYTGEPLCFELFVDRDDTEKIWDLLLERGAQPVGLGARDTLRLEAGLPLYGHELGDDPEGNEIPIFAIGLARFVVSFSPLKGEFIGKQPLYKQFQALQRIMQRGYGLLEDLPRRIMPVALTDKGIARSKSKVFRGEKHIGYITSGTMVPYWKTQGEGIVSELMNESGKRAIGLALLDSDLLDGDEIEVEIRKKRTKAIIVPYHLRSEAPPYSRPIMYEQLFEREEEVLPEKEARQNVHTLLEKAIFNTVWRQQECINLIPSEQTPSAMTRLLSIMDPVCRYAEHKSVKAFDEAEVFYYQGTDFISEVESLLEHELREFLGCAEVETRLVSGQMANTAVFSAMVDYVNRTDRKSEQRRLWKVMNNHIIRGGHLSAQPMGALRDFVARDPKTERPAVVNFPVLPENPYKIDVEACREVIAEHRPELIVLGKSMVIHTEPVKEMRTILDELDLDCVLMYDMAHVLGLVGPYFQQPFQEGADIVTGSTHKTYFGTQRGIVGVNYPEENVHYPLWEAIQRRAFPGSVSNHHLGTLLGLLMAACEMNAFKDEYQKNVLANAKSFALALKECGLDVAGDPDVSYTQTHQVILNVGYAKGPEIARQLEENNIIVNYQATPEEEGFTASGALRMGVSEMTRFGMGKEDFQELAQLMHAIIIEQRSIKEKVASFRKRFLEMKYCFSGNEFDDMIQKLHQLI
jgi:aminomethyltransferase